MTLRGTDTRLVAQRNDQVSRLTVQSNRLMATRRRDGATTQVEHPNRTDEEDPRAMEAFPGEGRCETGCVRGRGSGLLVEASGVYIPHGNGGNVRHPSPLIDAPIKFKRFIGFGQVGRGDGATDALRSLVNETRRLGAG